MALAEIGTPASLTFSNGGTNAVSNSGGTLTGAWGTGQNRAAGHLLVAVVTYASASSSTTIPTPSGWTKYEEDTRGAPTIRTATFFKVATGSDGGWSGTITIGGVGSAVVVQWEFSGQDATTPIFTYGHTAQGSGTVTVTSAKSLPVGAFALTSFTDYNSTSAAATFTAGGTGYSTVVTGQIDGLAHHSKYAFTNNASPASGSTTSPTGLFSDSPTDQLGIVAVIQGPATTTISATAVAAVAHVPAPSSVKTGTKITTTAVAAAATPSASKIPSTTIPAVAFTANAVVPTVSLVGVQYTVPAPVVPAGAVIPFPAIFIVGVRPPAVPPPPPSLLPIVLNRPKGAFYNGVYNENHFPPEQPTPEQPAKGQNPPPVPVNPGFIGPNGNRARGAFYYGVFESGTVPITVAVSPEAPHHKTDLTLGPMAVVASANLTVLSFGSTTIINPSGVAAAAHVPAVIITTSASITPVVAFAASRIS